MAEFRIADVLDAYRLNPDDEELATQALHYNYLLADRLSDRLKDDKRFLMNILKNIEQPKYGRNTEGLILKFVSKRLQDDDEFVMKCVSIDGDALRYASHRLRDDETIAAAAVINYAHALGGASDKLRGDKEFLLKLLPYVDSKNLSANVLSKELLDDGPFAEAFLSVAGWNLSRFSARLRDTKDVVLKAVSNCGFALSSASERLRGDWEIAFTAFCNDQCATKYMDKNLFKSRAVVVRLLEMGAGDFLESFPDEVRDDVELCKLACRHSKYADLHVSDRLKDDIEFARFLVQELKVNDIIWASDRIRENREIVLQMLKNGGTLSFVADSLCDDYEIGLLAVQNAGSYLSRLSERLRADPLIVFTALNGTYPHSEYWRADDWDGEYPCNLLESVARPLRDDPEFTGIVTEAFLRTEPGRDYTPDFFREDAGRIYSVFREITENMVLGEFEKVPYALDFTDAIEKYKKATV